MQCRRGYIFEQELFILALENISISLESPRRVKFDNLSFKFQYNAIQRTRMLQAADLN